MQANDARDLTRSGRVGIVPVDGWPSCYRIDVDGVPVGMVHNAGAGWYAVRPVNGEPVVVDRGRSRRHASVRRLLMSHPTSTFDEHSTTERDDDD